MTPDPITATHDAVVAAAAEALHAAELARAEHLRDVVAAELGLPAERLVADPQDGPPAVSYYRGLRFTRWPVGRPREPVTWEWCVDWPDANDGDGSEGMGETITAALDALAAQGPDEAAAVAVLRGEVADGG